MGIFAGSATTNEGTHLPLQEHQTVQIQVWLDEDSRAELEQISHFLVAAGLLTPPPHRDDIEPVSEAAWSELTEKLKASPGKAVSEIIIEERGDW